MRLTSSGFSNIGHPVPSNLPKKSLLTDLPH